MSIVILLLVCAAALVVSHYMPEKKPTGYGLTFTDQRRDNFLRMAEYERRLAIVRARVYHLKNVDFPPTRWQAYHQMIFSPPADNAFWMKHQLTRDHWWWRTAATVNSTHERMSRGLRYQRQLPTLKARQLNIVPFPMKEAQ